MSFRVWAETHSGAVRDHNEDAWLSRPELGMWAVADGAGGHASGEVASGMLATMLAEVPGDLPPQQLVAELRARVAGVHAALKREAARRGQDAIIASTIVILLVRGAHFACLWAGDSRAYLLRQGVLQQITHDHSLVQELVDAGVITLEQAETHPQANVITRAVGGGGGSGGGGGGGGGGGEGLDDALELDKVSGELAPGDRFLLCSDGLSKTLDDATLTAALAYEGEGGAAAELIATALEHETRDNVTAIVIDILPDTGTGEMAVQDAVDDGPDPEATLPGTG